MNQRGFIPIFILIILVAAAGIGLTVGTPYIKQAIQFITLSTPSPSPETPKTTDFDSGFNDLLSGPLPVTQTGTPTVKPKTTTPAKTKIPTPTAKPTQSSTSTTTTSCNYDLSSATGAIQFIFNPSSGSSLYWSTIGEVKTLNGCKVLDGKSTDTIQRFKSSGSNYLSIPSIPAGTYQVRYSYHDSWSSSQTISVSSGQQTNVTFSVNNSSDPAPTPTPNQKPSCSLLYMNISGTQKICVGITSNPTGSIISEYVDYEGDGSWDYSGPQYGCHDYAYTTGTHTAKAKVLGSPGTIGNESDICQTTFTVN